MQALVLDFGGVVTRTLFETHDLTERALGLPPGTLDWRGPFDPDNDLLWQRMQVGDISERDYWRERTHEVGALVGKNWTEMHEFVQAARGADPVRIIRPEFVETIEKCKAKGIRLAILSNELDLFYGKGIRHRLPFLADFDVISDATYTDILKPDLRAYQAVLDGLGLPASECVFVDDQIRNINGARALGLVTVHFDVKSPAASYAQARELLGLNEETPT